eukprot:gene4840-6030_t
MKEFNYDNSPLSPNKLHKKDDLKISQDIYTPIKKRLFSPVNTPRSSTSINNKSNIIFPPNTCSKLPQQKSSNSLLSYTNNNNNNNNILTSSLYASTSNLDLSTLVNGVDSSSTFDKVPMKVYLRIRPLSTEETKAKESTCFNILSKTSVSIKTAKSNADSEGKFAFSHVFPPITSQFQLFKTITQPLIESFLSGHNILMLAYGVTNAGKTYTISGNQKNPGVIPRSLDLIFKSIPKHCLKKSENNKHYEDDSECESDSSMSDSDEDEDQDESDQDLSSSDEETDILGEDNEFEPGNENDESSMEGNHRKKMVNPIPVSDQFNYSVWISYYEIYKDCIYDLLDDTTSRKQKQPLKLETEGHVASIKNLKEILVSSAEEAMDIIEAGESVRRVGETKLNHQSSRSHAVLNIKLFAYPKVANKKDLQIQQIKCSKLCIIDLAGSERANRTETTGERLKEATNINQSLFILGRCIEALKQKTISKNASNVVAPWRESKLTRICQEYFVANGKASMIVNVSPTNRDAEETLNVLKFSANAKEISTQSKIKPLMMAPPPPTPISSNRKRKTMDPQTVGTSTPSITSSSAPAHTTVTDIQNAINEIKKKIHLEDSRHSLQNQKVGIDFVSMERDQLLDQIQVFQKKIFDYEVKVSEMEISLREQFSKEMANSYLDMETKFNKRLSIESKLMQDRFQSKLSLIKNVQMANSKSDSNRYQSEIDKLVKLNQDLQEKHKKTVEELIKTDDTKVPPPQQQQQNTRTDQEWITEISDIQIQRDNLQNQVNVLIGKLESITEKQSESETKINELCSTLKEVEDEKSSLLLEMETLQSKGNELIKRRELEVREAHESIEQYKEKIQMNQSENNSLLIQLQQEKKEKQALQEELTRWKLKAEESTNLLNHSFGAAAASVEKDRSKHVVHFPHASPFKKLNNHPNMYTTPLKSTLMGKIALFNEGTSQNTIYKGDVVKSVSGQGVSVRFTDTEIVPSSPSHHAPGTPTTIATQTPDRALTDPYQYSDSGLLMREIKEEEEDRYHQGSIPFDCAVDDDGDDDNADDILNFELPMKKKKNIVPPKKDDDEWQEIDMLDDCASVTTSVTSRGVLKRPESTLSTNCFDLDDEPVTTSTTTTKKKINSSKTSLKLLKEKQKEEREKEKELEKIRLKKEKDLEKQREKEQKEKEKEEREKLKERKPISGGTLKKTTSSIIPKKETTSTSTTRKGLDETLSSSSLSSVGSVGGGVVKVSKTQPTTTKSTTKTISKIIKSKIPIPSPTKIKKVEEQSEEEFEIKQQPKPKKKLLPKSTQTTFFSQKSSNDTDSSQSSIDIDDSTDGDDDSIEIKRPITPAINKKMNLRRRSKLVPVIKFKN